jgi:NAD(P)H-quinone oxidoreductase subunit 5
MERLIKSDAVWDRREAAAITIGLFAATAFSASALIRHMISTRPDRFAGLTIDRLSALSSLLVAGLGTAVFLFASTQLQGNPRRTRFLRLLAFTIGSAYLLMCSSNLALIFAAWSSTSLGLHALLTIYEDRPEAIRPARKKFLISRLGDLALLSAFVLIGRDWGTFDVNDFLAAVVAHPETSSSATWIGLLIAIAALTKSAQFPFHTWLPETMEAPTPVSALMHAGVINAGGALLLRFAPLIVRIPSVLLLLAFIGTVTFVIGMIAMWAQSKVKRTLAWSTVSQMGFMMVQCGLGAFPAATIHMIGHGCYKAWSFLSSGEPRSTPKTKTSADPARTLVLLAIGTLSAVPALAFAAWTTGRFAVDSPGEISLLAIIALSAGQIWVAIFRDRERTRRIPIVRIAAAIGADFALAILALTINRIATNFLEPVFQSNAGSIPSSLASRIAAILPPLAVAALSIFYALTPVIDRFVIGRALYVHALNGFYLGAYADRIVDSIWPARILDKSGNRHA